jgi:H+/gluconate symporter-like permease
MAQPYHIVRGIVKKLPASWLRFALPMCTAVFMTFLVSGVATWRALGAEPGMVWTWMTSWLIAWLIAAPTMFVMMPLVRRWLLRIIEDPEDAAKKTPAS